MESEPLNLYAPVANRGRLRFIVTETNSKDFFKGGWPSACTLGYALVTFDTLGRVMEQKRVLSAMVWTTRCMADAKARNDPFYALGPANEILLAGPAVALWGQFIQINLIAVTGEQGTLTPYASCSQNGRNMLP